MTAVCAGNATASTTESVSASTLTATTGETPASIQQSAEQPRRSPRIAQNTETEVINVDSQTEAGITAGVDEQIY
jgi:hypothetical protein